MWLPKHKIKGEKKKINNNHLQKKKKKYIKDKLNLNDNMLFIAVMVILLS